MSIKKMSVAEFRCLGYLQEVNRQFLHPLGLAIEVVVNDDGSESFGEVWDSRDDPEGIIYDDGLLGVEDGERGRRIEEELEERKETRCGRLGFDIQPLPEAPEAAQ